MMRSLYSGVSGLKAHQTRMDVIGNNIANVNTTAYKSKSMNFADMLYQTTQSATAPNTENQTAGTNPRQIGLGVKTGAINTSITTEGASQSTGNPFDLKITGEAFFVVTDGTNQYFTRDGSFDVDASGYLCMGNTGYIVEGWTNVDSETGAIIQDSVKPIRVLSAANETYPASYTTKASVNGIIDMYDDQLDTENGKLMNIQVLDDKGYEYNLKFGITPVTNNVTSTKLTYNTERTYTLPQSIQYEDVSTISIYRDVVTTSSVSASNIASMGTECTETDLPADLYAAIVSDAKSSTATGNSHTFGTNDLVTVKIDQDFLNNHTNLDSAKIQASTWWDQTLQIAFSGDTAYTAYTNTGGSASSGNVSLGQIDLSADALSTLYGVTSTSVAANASYNLDTNQFVNGEILVTEMTFSDGTDPQYEYRTTDGSLTQLTLTESDLSKLLATDGSPTVQAQYTTRSDISTPKRIDGSYQITLVGMTDSEGNEVDNWDTALNIDPVDLVYKTSDGSFSYVGSEGNTSFSLNLSALGSNFSNVSFDMSGTSNVNNGGKSTVEGSRDDGYMVGQLTGVSIGTDGVITANYDNGMQKSIAQISVATFENSMGLENVGDNLYTTTANSGSFDGVGVDIKGSGTGYITTGVLEMSNVDLASEFTNMITTQRGFQANSRIITTSDTLLEELVNLKR